MAHSTDPEKTQTEHFTMIPFRKEAKLQIHCPGVASCYQCV